MSVSYKLIKHWSITPNTGFNYVYYLPVKNGKLYQFGISDGTIGFAGGEVQEEEKTKMVNGNPADYVELNDPLDLVVYEADTFLGFLQLFIDNNITFDGLDYLRLQIKGSTVNEQVTQEIFSLQTSDITYITSNFDPIDLVKKLGLYALAQKLLISGVWGNLLDAQGALDALGIMADIGAYWINNKVGSTKEGMIKDAVELGESLVSQGAFTVEQAENLIIYFTQIIENKLGGGN